jgi:hypothetical protein
MIFLFHPCSFIFPSVKVGQRRKKQIIHKPDTAHAENKDHTLDIITPRCPFDGIPGEIITGEIMIMSASVSGQNRRQDVCEN